MPALSRGLALLLGCLSPLAAPAQTEALRYLDVCFNGRCATAVAVLAGAPGQWWVDSRAVAEAGLDFAGWPVRRHGDHDYVEVLAAIPQATAAFDAPTQTVRFTLPGAAWPARTYPQEASRSRPVVSPSSLASAFVNYSLVAGSRGDASAYIDAGWVRGPWLVRSSFAVDGDGWRRRLTSMELDQPQHQRRWVLGDQYVGRFDPFASTPRIAGLGMVRAFDLTPGFVRFPGADIRGVMQAPGTIDVYANGVRVATEAVEAGPFDLQDLVLSQGSNDLRIVVNDPFAGRYEIAGDYYSAPQLLRRGLHEFDDRIGWVARGDEYASGPPLVSLKHRYGLNDQITGGLRYEQLGGRRNLGAALALVPGVGTLALALSRSEGREKDGLAWRADYAFQSRRFGLGFGLRRQSGDYEPVLVSTSRLARAVPARERYAQGSWAIGRRVSLGARWLEQDFVDGSHGRVRNLSLGWRIGRLRANLGISRREGRDDAGREALLVLQAPLGRDTASLGVQRTDGLDEWRFSTQHSPPADAGWGYRLDLSRSADARGAVLEFEQVSRFGDANLRIDDFDGDSAATLRYAGSLVWAGGDLFAARSSASGYVVVETPGVANVPVLRENLPVGVTGEDGRLLVPGLLPYQANLLAIDLRALDAGVAVSKERDYVSVPRLGVGRVVFPVTRLRPVQALLVVRRDGAMQRLSGGEAKAVASGQVATIGREGQVYFDELASGRQVLEVHTGELELRCALDVPAAGAMAWMGEVVCTAP